MRSSNVEAVSTMSLLSLCIQVSTSFNHAVMLGIEKYIDL